MEYGKILKSDPIGKIEEWEWGLGNNIGSWCIIVNVMYLQNKVRPAQKRQDMMIKKPQNQLGINKKPCCPKIAAVWRYISAVMKL